ncbi:hypothetical protein [Bacillus cereus]|uniref:hypothetical protein n=1 Tax=Bacillus cereus TaxID=1396 RepID=UPI003D1696FB
MNDRWIFFITILFPLYPNVNFEIANNMGGAINYQTASEKKTGFQGNQSYKY